MPNALFSKPIFLHSLEDTKALAHALSNSLKKGDVLALHGDLGAGKTTFAQFLIQKLMEQDLEVPSPTFTLVNVYEGPTFPVWHFDLYRLKSPEEIFETGFEEALATALTIVEWPCRADAYFPKNHLRLEFYRDDKNQRCAKLTPSK